MSTAPHCSRAPLLCRSGLLLVCSLGLALLAHSAEQASVPPAAPAPVQVGVLTDNYPFSFTASDGHAQGFAVDLLAAVERAMGLQLNRIPGPTNEINTAFREGRIALIQSFAPSAERRQYAEFSVPYLTMAGVVFTRKDAAPVASLADLRNRRVMVHRGSLGEQLLHNAGLDASVVYVDSVEQALQQLDAGNNDATLCSRLTGLASVHRLGLKHIAPNGGPLPGYEVRYCFAVQKGDSALLAQLNEGLAILHETGEYERIFQKWFGHLEPYGFTATDIALAIAAGLALALAVAIGAGVRQRLLARRIAAQAEALRRSEVRHRGIFENSIESLLLLTAAPPAEFLLEQANVSARRLLPLNDNYAGATLDQALQDNGALSSAVAQALAGADPIFEHRHHTPAGKRWWRVAVSRIDDHVLLALADITAAKEAEQRLQQQEQQIRQAQKLDAIGNLAAGVAHDFNNVLTSIIGNAELARLELPPAQTELVSEILTAADRARRLVRQILTFSRQAEVRRAPLAITAVIDEAVRFLRASVPASIEIRHEEHALIPAIVGDSTQIHQVLMNLGTNAAHAMRGRQGLLEIVEDVFTLTPELASQHAPLTPGDYVRLSVRDTGTGMPPEVMQHIFEPFFTTKAPGEGTGLGLSVVHGILLSHGGTITVYSKPGEGTIFRLYFPVAPGVVAEHPDETATPPRGHGELVLLVDDEPSITEAIGRILVRLGYRIVTANDPEKALRRFIESPSDFAAVLSDFTMPHLSGLELAARLHRRRPELPIVLMSGFITERERAQANALRITQLLDKPPSLAALANALHHALAHGAAR